MISDLRKIKRGIDYSIDQPFNDDFLEGVRQKRVNYIEAAKDNEFFNGLENLLTRLYPDNAHFIYELLQNAEDAGATRVHFSLQEDCLYFLHNGDKSFSADDISSITSIGQSQKTEDTNKIGKFGVGFKSVFSYTSTPSVHSSSISFLIKDMLMPSKLAAEEIPDQYTTLFIFPFNNPDKSKNKAYEEVFRLFDKLSDTTLLFLNGIQEINWNIEDQERNSIKRKDKGGYIEICSTSEDSSYWHIFTKKIDINVNNKSDSFDVKIAYAYDINKNSIVETNGGVAIFFPADSEVSKLKFHIHAPFSSTVARDSIVKDNKENQQLILGIANLCCESLHKIKEGGMLTTDFLGVLPNKDDELSNTYLPILEKLIQEFERGGNSLIPIEGNLFSSLQNCRFTKKIIKNIFDADDLKILLNNEKLEGFAINASQLNNRADKFYNSLDREFFYENDLIECLATLNSDVLDEEINDANHYDDDERFFEIEIKREWLTGKNNEWLQSLYALLFDFSESWALDDVSCLTSIVKLSDGSFNYSDGAVYFSDSQQFNAGFKFVNQATYLSGKDEKKKQKSKEFLEHVGVRNLDESVHIKLLFENYKFESEKKYVEDINRLVRFYINENSLSEDFRYFNFIYTSKNNIVRPLGIGIDTPFESTGLRFVVAYQDIELLNPIYQNLQDQDAFLKLIKNLGARTTLEINSIGITNNPDRNRLARDAQGQRWTNTAVNKDWIIKGLDEMLADQEHPIEISRLIWHTMSTVGLNPIHSEFEAHYRMNSAYPMQTSKSQLIHILSDADWLPDKDGIFYNPKDIDQNLLSSDFIYNNESGWLNLIDFGLNAKLTSNDRDNAEELVQNISGLSLADLEMIKASGLTKERLLEIANNEKQQSLRMAMEQNQGLGISSEINNDDSHDDSIIIDEERHQDNITKENINVSTKTKVISSLTTKQNAEELNKVRDFLYKQYKGHCQICGDTFTGKNNKHYYETFSLNRGGGRDVNRKGNSICLCPKHHAIFKQKLQNLSFMDDFTDSELTLGGIRQKIKFRYSVGKIDISSENDGFYLLPSGDDFEGDVFLLPIRLFNKIFYIKFTQDHIQNFIEVWNNN